VLATDKSVTLVEEIKEGWGKKTEEAHQRK
jgi:hypothetical protein